MPKEYWAKEPVGLRWLFVLDVSQDAIDKGFLHVICEGILEAIYGDPEALEKDEEYDPESAKPLPLGSKVGFVTFDKAVQFYNCHVSR